MGTLTENLNNWKEEREIIQSEHISIVPSDLCFMSTCALPQGKVSNAVIENCALLSLEQSSPFPPSDMFWGYTVDTETATIYTFSALKSRVKPIDGAVESAAYILPEFIIPILDHSISQAVLKYGESVTMYEKTAGSEIVLSPVTEADAALPIFELQSVTAVPEFGIAINYIKRENQSAEAMENVAQLPFVNMKLMAANMQNSGLKRINKNNKVMTNILLTLTIGSTFLACIGVAGLFQLRNMVSQEKKKMAQLQSNEPKVAQIQQKDSRAHELDLFSNKKHAYFRGLDQVNALRPDSILFNSYYASEGNRFEVKCTSKNFEDINRFEKKLSDSSIFKVVKVEDKNVQNLPTGTIYTFSLFLEFEKI
jgi:hypothetical protein